MTVRISTSLRAQVDERISSRHLLNHPFYVAWTKGELSREQLAQYAAQYMQYVLAEPTFLSAVHANTPHFATDGKIDLHARQTILLNLIEEEAGAKNHPALWKQFAAALGLSEGELAQTSPLPATRQLIETFTHLCRNRPYYAGLAALHAFESQVPAIAGTKIEGLRKFYGISDPSEIEFFTVHEKADVWHSKQEWDLIERAADTPEKQAEVLGATAEACDALWSFLDSVYAPWGDGSVGQGDWASMKIAAPEVRGIDLDAETRCAHYHSVLDIVAIKAKCCGCYYACKDCHDAIADHPLEPWPRDEWHTEKALLCGACRSELTVAQYLGCSDHCPACSAPFNPACHEHRVHYFSGA